MESIILDKSIKSYFQLMKSFLTLSFHNFGYSLGRHNDKNIKEVLGEFIATNKRVAYGYYTSHIDEIWKQEMGHVINNYTSRLTFKDGILNVYLTSAPLRKELSMGKDKIKDILNRALGADLVQNIQIF